MKICTILMELFVVGTFTIARWGTIGEICQVCIMVCLALSIVVKQYNDRKTGIQDRKLFYAYVFLPAVLLMGIVCCGPEYQWINEAVLIGLAAVHVYFALSSGNSKKMRMGYIRDTLYSTLFVALIQIYGEIPFYAGDF